MSVEIWHNPRCGKSRAALAWLEARGIAARVRLYLVEAPGLDELREMQAALGLPAAAMLRKEGAALREAPETAILAALAETPALIERPIVRRGSRAVIARPDTAGLSALCD